MPDLRARRTPHRWPGACGPRAHDSRSCPTDTRRQGGGRRRGSRRRLHRGPGEARCSKWAHSSAQEVRLPGPAGRREVHDPNRPWRCHTALSTSLSAASAGSSAIVAPVSGHGHAAGAHVPGICAPPPAAGVWRPCSRGGMTRTAFRRGHSGLMRRGRGRPTARSGVPGGHHGLSPPRAPAERAPKTERTPSGGDGRDAPHQDIPP